MAKAKLLLVLSFFTSFICTFPSVHVVLPLLIAEPVMIISALSGDSSASFMSWLCFILLLAGQVMIAVAVFVKSFNKVAIVGSLGLLFLTSAIIIFYFLIEDKMFKLTFYTSLPYIICMALFIYNILKIRKSKQTQPHTPPQPKHKISNLH